MRQNGNFAMWEVSPAPTRPALSSLTSFHYLYIHTHVHPYIHTYIQLSTDSPGLCLFTVQSKVDRQLWQRFLDAAPGDDSNTHHTRVDPILSGKAPFVPVILCHVGTQDLFFSRE